MRSIVLVALLASACSSSKSPAVDGGNHGDGGGGSGSGSSDGGGDCSCDTAPAATCTDAMTLQSFRAPGTCNASHTCDFESYTSTCPFGCSGGACQAEACTPFCPVNQCGNDGCGGTCGTCPSGTTFPGLTATSLGIADDMTLAPDGIHLATVRDLQPLSPSCGFNPAKVGTMDVWTVPASGAATHVTIGAHVPLYTARFTDDGYLLYNDNTDPCTGRGDLWIAHADGSAPHVIATNVLASFELGGHTVWWSADDPNDPDPNTFNGFLFAAALPDGAPKQLAPISYNSYYGVSPDGTSAWVDKNSSVNDLALWHVDGTSSVLTSSGFAFYPTWSPAGDKLAYPVSTGSGITMNVVDASGANTVVLDSSCGACGDFNAIAWSSDGARVAWLRRPPTFGLDAQIHTIAGGADVTLTGVVSPSTGGQVFRLTFSNDNLRLYAAAGSDTNGWKLMSGAVAASGAMAPLVASLASDGDQFQTSWLEAPDGSVLAAMGGDTTTKVITLGGATNSIAGSVSEQPKLETGGAARWLVAHGTALSIYPTNGSGAGTALAGYASNYNLSEVAFSGYIPFVFGWGGSTALYPSNPAGSYPKMTEDLMATTSGAVSGRLGSLVNRFRVAAAPARVYFTTSGEGLFWVTRP